MSNHNSIIGTLRLNTETNIIPADGLMVSRHRVELLEEGKSDLSWMAELNVLGDLPWFKGEERQVEVRIMSDEFRQHVVSERPNLLVKRGRETVGTLELKSGK
ncbi:hypothetical protein [Microbulbifer sp. GL-2]|uniref:hypothetical protein n=1 Tax=Microbulbifer sp. GL-2 TaxID=2591606 RepID=UPI0011634D1D|nr:hypothetical protein [Microbulbifer sp. GL-2]BBM03557.1 hypothetical protein GL2_36310 [Microbulbifer sp. GL-2]